ERTCSDSRQQFRNTDGLRPETVEGRQMPLEHEIATAEAGLLDREDIHRALHDAQQAIVTAWIGALRAQLLFAQRPALLAIPHLRHGAAECLRQAQTTTAIAFQHLQGHALRRLLPDAGENPQGIDELADEGTEAHK